MSLVNLSYKSLLEHFAEIDYKEVRYTVAGNIRTAADCRKIIEGGVDFVSIGRAGILHHDFPAKVLENSNFVPLALPVTAEYLKKEGLGKAFITYMRRWQGFVED